MVDDAMHSQGTLWGTLLAVMSLTNARYELEHTNDDIWELKHEECIKMGVLKM